MSAKLRATLLLLLPMVTLLSFHSGYAQTGNSPAERRANTISLTGVLLVSDFRCEESRAKSDTQKLFCPERASDWGLLAGPGIYSLRGNATDFKKYERCRVTVTGTIIEKMVIVDSITAAEITKSEIRSLIDQLKSHYWTGPKNYTRPTQWIFDFTSPMLQILQAGPAAQDILLQHLDDRDIKDQIIILLGGVGDEKAIEPIIRAMVDSDGRANSEANEINLKANLALTNITQSEVIWHHGGGISIDHCPDRPKSCWYDWWTQNRDSFKVSTETGNRNYSNYPNYGIYRQS